LTSVVAVALASLMMRASSLLLSIIVWPKANALASIAFNRTFGGPLDLHRELTALGGDRGDQPAALLIEQAGELGRIAVHRRRDFVGLADKIASHLAADVDQAALDLGRVLA